MERDSMTIDRISIVKISVLPNLIYRFSAVPNRIPVSYFIDITKPMLQFIWEDKRLGIARKILKMNSHRTNYLPKTYYKAKIRHCR